MREQFAKGVRRGQTRAEWCRDFYQKALKTGRLYLQADCGHLVYVDPSFGPRRIFSASDFYGILHSLVEVVTFRQDDNGEWQVAAALLNREETANLSDSPEKTLLPVLRALVFEPVVVPKGPGFRIIPPGFDPESGYYYWTAPGTAPISIVEGTEHLSKVFAGVPFERPAYKANLIAWLLGAISADQAMQTPFLVCDGNQQGVGKTSVVQAAGYILSGGLPSPIDPRGQEFWKQLSTRFVENDRVIFLDNITTHRGGSYDNEHLSGLLTQGTSKRIRILGQSKTVSAAGILFAASLNDAKLSADLSERSLLVRLFREKNQPMVPYCKEYAIEHRRALYGELLWLATQPAPPVEDCVHSNFRFRRWLQFVMPRVEKFFGPMGIEEARSLDDATQELFSWGADNVSSPFFAAEFLPKILAFADRYPCLYQRVASISSERGKAISIGRLLKQHVGDVHSIQNSLKIKLVALPRDEGGNRYEFQEVK